MASRPRDDAQFLYSPAINVAQGSTFGLGTNLSWDGYRRGLYNQQNALFRGRPTSFYVAG